MNIVILSKILKEWNMLILTKCVSELYVNGWSCSYIKILSRNSNDMEYLQVLNNLASVIMKLWGTDEFRQVLFKIGPFNEGTR